MPGICASLHALNAFLFIKDRGHLPKLIEHIGPEPRHFVHLVKAALHFILK